MGVRSVVSKFICSYMGSGKFVGSFSKCEWGMESVKYVWNMKWSQLARIQSVRSIGESDKILGFWILGRVVVVIL